MVTDEELYKQLYGAELGKLYLEVRHNAENYINGTNGKWFNPEEREDLFNACVSHLMKIFGENFDGFTLKFSQSEFEVGWNSCHIFLGFQLVANGKTHTEELNLVCMKEVV